MKVLAFNTVRAPYRVDLYNSLGEKVDLTVFFEQEHDCVRTKEWYSNDFKNFKMVHAKRWDRPLSYLKLDVLKYAKRQNIDLVYMSEWSSVTALLLIFKCIVCKIPYVISMDGYLFGKPKRFDFIKKIIKKYIANHALATIGTGKSTQEYAKYIGFGLEKIFTVGFTSIKDNEILKQPITQQDKQFLKEKLHLDKEKKYVISVGQFVYRKGFDLLIESWKKINNTHDWELLIIGDGKEKESLLKRLYQLNISNITVLNSMCKSKLFDYYKASEFFVLNTREDIWGLVVNEAMANGLPVLTTNQCVAGKELIENGINGYLYDCEDLARCAECLDILMTDELLRAKISENNLKKIKEYTIESEAEKISEILYSLIN